MIAKNKYGEPLTIYKYRDWNNHYHRRLLLDPSVYLSAPSDFEDPLDCKIPIRYDLLSDIEIFDKYYKESKKANPHFDFNPHFNKAIDGYMQSPLRDSKRVKEIDEYFSKEFNERFGVLSLTEDPLNPEMWAKYGSEQTGFCVGYDNELLFNSLGGGGNVTYVDKLPIIKPFEPFEVQHHKQVFHKERKWEFEKEYRTHKFWEQRVTSAERSISINRDSIKEVVLGAKMEKSHKEEIEEIVRKSLSHVKIKETKQENGIIKFCT